jgi:hypothetical protein
MRLQRFAIDSEDRARGEAARTTAEKQFASLRAPLVALVDRHRLVCNRRPSQSDRPCRT